MTPATHSNRREIALQISLLLVPSACVHQRTTSSTNSKRPSETASRLSMGSGRRSGLLQSGLSWGFSRRCFSSVAVATPGMGLCTAAVMTKDAAVATEGMPSVVILPTMCRKNEAIFSFLRMHRLLVEGLLLRTTIHSTVCSREICADKRRGQGMPRAVF